MEKISTEEIYNEDQEYEVEKILKEKIKPRKNPKTGKMEYIKEYLVKWIGYEDPSWEPEQNLNNCKELLSEFLIKNLKKSKSSRKAKTPLKINLKKNNKLPIEYKTPRKLYCSQSNIIDEPSTGSNSFGNNSCFLSKKRKRKNKNKNKNKNKKISDITVLEESDEVQNMQNMHYDIEIIDDNKEEEKSTEIISNSKTNTKILLSSSSKESINNPQFNFDKNSSQDNGKNECEKEKEKGKEKGKENNMEVITIEESNNNIGKYSQTIYIDKYDDDNEEYKNNNEMESQIIDNYNKSDKKEMVIDYYEEEVKEDKDAQEIETIEKNQNNSNEKELLNNYLEKKIYLDKYGNDEDINEENNFKVMGIYGVKVLENYGKGFILNVKFKKNNKIYYDEFDSHSGKIPREYIIKYYERLISQSFEKGEYFQELCFD